ncbi:unnamed protein product [Urochloa humidicola]
MRTVRGMSGRSRGRRGSRPHVPAPHKGATPPTAASWSSHRGTTPSSASRPSAPTATPDAARFGLGHLCPCAHEDETTSLMRCASFFSWLPWLLHIHGVRQNAPAAFGAAERSALATKAAAPVAPVQAPNLPGLWLSIATAKVAARHKCLGKKILATDIVEDERQEAEGGRNAQEQWPPALPRCVC